LQWLSGTCSAGDAVMLALKYVVMIFGVALFGSSAALVGYDIYLSAQLQKILRRGRVVERLG